jgi:hypothetical protein
MRFLKAQSLPEGGLLWPKEFLHLGSRAAIDQVLSRLAREGKLLRVGRGAYSSPVQGRFGIRPPSTESVMEALETSSGELVGRPCDKHAPGCPAGWLAQ